MRSLARILADDNPIHLDPEAVKALGMGTRPINQGPANMSYILNLLGDSFPGAWLRSFDVRFLSNVFAGDRVLAGGTIAETVERDDTFELRCDVWLDVDGGSRALAGVAVLALPRGTTAGAAAA
jgi:acyl dehydratase